MGKRTSCRFATALVAVLAAAAACHGPALHVENPGGHAAFLDGVATKTGVKPFRYYGTTRWDALPAELEHGIDTERAPASGSVEVPAPASQWLFPFDFPLELLARAFGGVDDQTVVVDVRSAPSDPRTETERVNAEVVQVAGRAFAARASR